MDPKRQELLFQLNKNHFKKQNLKSITIDIDGSALPVDGHQENAEKGYCPEEHGNRCFQMLVAVYDQTETVLSEKTYPGNTKFRRLRFILFTAIATFPRHARKRLLNLTFLRITPWKFKFIMDRVWAY